jgi:ribonuclease Z
VDLDVVFLGTSASAPTARRGVAATLVRRGGDRLLFDCGEGTQRQLLRSSVGLVDLREIYLTHFHADHVLGLPGMLKTFALRGRDVPLTVYGPRGLEELFASLRRIFGKLTYPLDLIELEPGEEVVREDYSVVPFRVRHASESVGYALVERERPGRFDASLADELGVPFGPERGALQRGEPVTLADGRIFDPEQLVGETRPGRTLVLTGDTAPCDAVTRHAEGADLLIHEASFCDDELDRARETNHSTAAGAAEIARQAGVRLLALTHLSNRYFGPEVAREARAVFAATEVPKDFDTIEVPFRERGEPQLVRGGALPGEEPTAAPVAHVATEEAQ